MSYRTTSDSRTVNCFTILSESQFSPFQEIVTRIHQRIDLVNHRDQRQPVGGLFLLEPISNFFGPHPLRAALTRSLQSASLSDPFIVLICKMMDRKKTKLADWNNLLHVAVFLVKEHEGAHPDTLCAMLWLTVRARSICGNIELAPDLPKRQLLSGSQVETLVVVAHRDILCIPQLRVTSDDCKVLLQRPLVVFPINSCAV